MIPGLVGPDKQHDQYQRFNEFAKEFYDKTNKNFKTLREEFASLKEGTRVVVQTQLTSMHDKFHDMITENGDKITNELETQTKINNDKLEAV